MQEAGPERRPVQEPGQRQHRLTDDEVRRVRDSTLDDETLASQMGVNVRTVRDARRRATYQEVPDRPGTAAPIPRTQPKPLQRNHIRLYAEAAGQGATSPAGFAAIISHDGMKPLLTAGHEPASTTNRMFLTAVNEGLALINARPELAGEPIMVRTTSEYTANAIRGGWHQDWKKRGWLKADNQPPAHLDLWKQLEQALSAHPASATHVSKENPGQPADPLSEQCRQIATGELEEAQATGRMHRKIGLLLPETKDEASRRMMEALSNASERGEPPEIIAKMVREFSGEYRGR